LPATRAESMGCDDLARHSQQTLAEQPSDGARRRNVMRTCIVLVMLGASAYADDTAIRMQRHREAPAEPLLQLDATILDPTIATGGIVDGRSALLGVGPRARLAVESRWWQAGLAPSMFAADLRDHGWRAAAELSYDLGPFRVGVHAALTHTRESSHQVVGLFAFRTFRLSRWMHAWIVLGISYEQWRDADVPMPRQGLNVGLSLGTTFR
jgi:hypothetical protein